MPKAQREIKGPLRRAIFERYPGCVVCGTWDADQCGHRIAKSKGGDNSVDNFMRLCAHCNKRQGPLNIQVPFAASVTESRRIVEHRRKYWILLCNYMRKNNKEGSGVFNVKDVDALPIE